MKKFDLIVIGSGPAGEKGAAQAAYFGKKVGMVELGQFPGGIFVNTGTIPSKCLREAALYYSGLLQRGLYGIDYSLRDGLTVHDFMHRKDAVVDLERDKVQKNLLAHHIEMIHGSASFEDARTLRVQLPDGGTETLTADFILIATGSRPYRPADIPFDDHFIFDSDTILGMDRIPKSMIVVGGGVIGCEYASMFTALGVKVIFSAGSDRLLPFLDAEISARLKDRLEYLGLELILNDRPATVATQSNSVRVTMKSGRVLETETALLSTGRTPLVAGLGLDKAGIALNERHAIAVNEHYQTSLPHIYAAGDVIGFPALGSTSMEQGRVAVCHAFGLNYKQHLPQTLPLGIYTIPEISSVGETEETCKAKGIAYEVGRARYTNNARGQMIGETHGLLKLVFRRDNLRLLGVHLIGENATDLVHIGMIVIELGGGINTLVDSVFNAPTLSEMYKAAAYDGLGNLAGFKLKEG
ncbi:MAG TPA: Si-specific NAD(P)(+) transhydrogenase [Terriglobia bacterium]|nr:Si-specific NAD(P)(+) transhydrogenase [Terriglobia bacterium]